MTAYTTSVAGKQLCIKQIVLLWTVNWLSIKLSVPGFSNDGINRYILWQR